MDGRKDNCAFLLFLFLSFLFFCLSSYDGWVKGGRFSLMVHQYSPLTKAIHNTHWTKVSHKTYCMVQLREWSVGTTQENVQCELKAGGTKRDVENTPKCPRLRPYPGPTIPPARQVLAELEKKAQWQARSLPLITKVQKTINKLRPPQCCCRNSDF